MCFSWWTSRLPVSLQNYQLLQRNPQPIMPSPPFNVISSTASELQDRLKAGTITSVEVITAYLAQIEKHNHAGAKLNAVIGVAPREVVLKAARKLDRERTAGKTRGPFHGLPIIVKVWTKEGRETHFEGF